MIHTTFNQIFFFFQIRYGILFLALATIAQCQGKEKREIFNTIDLSERLEDTLLVVGGRNYKQNPGQTTTFKTTRIPTTIPFAKQTAYNYKPSTLPTVVPKRSYEYKPPDTLPPIVTKNNYYEYKPPTYEYKPPVTFPPVITKKNIGYEYTAPTYLPPIITKNVTPAPTKQRSSYLPPIIIKTNPTSKTPYSYLPPTKVPNTYLPPSTPGNKYLIPTVTRPTVTYPTLPPLKGFPIPSISQVYKPYIYKTPDIVNYVIPPPPPLPPINVPPILKKGYVYEDPAQKFLDEEGLN